MMGRERATARRALLWVATGKRYVVYEAVDVEPDAKTVVGRRYVRPRDEESVNGRPQRGLDLIEQLEDDEGAVLMSIVDGAGNDGVPLYMFRKMN